MIDRTLLRATKMEMGNALERNPFGLDEEDQPYMFYLLRKQLYSDEIWAPIREYTVNAYDAHASIGSKQVPQITVPTEDEPIFKVRDFGPGLSYDDIKNLYVKYCKSNKRNTNKETGFFGIGCKSAFCYTDSFVVISYLDGQRTVYNAVLSNAVGDIIKLNTEDTTEANGIEIHIPVKQNDVSLWQSKIAYFVNFLEPKPILVNSEIDHTIEYGIQRDDWGLRKGSDSDYNPLGSKNYVVMGNVPYELDIDKLDLDPNLPNRAIILALESLVIKVKMGSVTMTPSRETLQYDEKTKKYLITKLSQIATALIDIVKEDIVRPTLWASSARKRELFDHYSTSIIPRDLRYTLNYEIKDVRFQTENGDFISIQDSYVINSECVAIEHYKGDYKRITTDHISPRTKRKVIFVDSKRHKIVQKLMSIEDASSFYVVSSTVDGMSVQDVINEGTKKDESPDRPVPYDLNLSIFKGIEPIMLSSLTPVSTARGNSIRNTTPGCSKIDLTQLTNGGRRKRYRYEFVTEPVSYADYKMALDNQTAIYIVKQGRGAWSLGVPNRLSYDVNDIYTYLQKIQKVCEKIGWLMPHVYLLQKNVKIRSGWQNPHQYSKEIIKYLTENLDEAELQHNANHKNYNEASMSHRYLLCLNQAARKYIEQVRDHTNSLHNNVNLECLYSLGVTPDVERRPIHDLIKWYELFSNGYPALSALNGDTAKEYVCNMRELRRLRRKVKLL